MSRSSLVAIYNTGTPEKPNFRMAKPSIIPVDGDGKISWIAQNDWQNGPMAAQDCVVLEEDMTGRDSLKPTSFPGCVPKEGLRVTRGNRVTWMASCDPAVIKTLPRSAPRVIYDESRFSVSSRFYSYGFKRFNQMLFDKVEAVSPKSGTTKILAEDSDLYIKADVKKFFTLNFHSDELESKLENYRIDSVAALASLSFYLKVLFFRITMDLKTDVAFFESSAYIPMTLSLPVNAARHLRRRSGVLYSFRVPNKDVQSQISAVMPALDPARLDGSYKNAADAYCADKCRFTLMVKDAASPLTMDLEIKRDLVSKGLFPWFVRDVESSRKEMGWSLPDRLNMENRVGLYFEMSELPKGSHPWDFWISFK